MWSGAGVDICSGFAAGAAAAVAVGCGVWTPWSCEHEQCRRAWSAAWSAWCPNEACDERADDGHSTDLGIQDEFEEHGIRQYAGWQGAEDKRDYGGGAGVFFARGIEEQQEEEIRAVGHRRARGRVQVGVVDGVFGGRCHLRL